MNSVKNTYGGVLILVKLQAEACNFTKINTPPYLVISWLLCSEYVTGESMVMTLCTKINGKFKFLFRKRRYLPTKLRRLIRVLTSPDR